MTSVILLLTSLLLLPICFRADAAGDESFSPIINTKSGPVRGVLIHPSSDPSTAVYQFAGIPFAEPPLGALRYRKPTPIKPWNNVLDTITAPNPCIQSDAGVELRDQNFQPIPGSEDCLYLNVWIPKSALDALVNGSLSQPLSTYIFIHGGTFLGGSASKYNSTLLSGLNDVIVATIQYRLGSLGFAYYGTEDVPGNMGLWDQFEAIKWLSENIEAFGGNSNLITIGGQSAGAASVTFHLLSPYSRKYFQRAIVESGSANAVWAARTPQQGINVTDMMFKQIGPKVCKQTTEIQTPSVKTRCLKMADPYSIASADELLTLSGFVAPFTPVIDGDFVPRDPSEMLQSGDFYKVPLLIGATKDETSLYLAMTPEGMELLPSPTNPNKTIDPNLNMTHYNTLIEGAFKFFLSGLMPTNLLMLSAVQWNYLPQNGSGVPPHGSEIVQAVSNIMSDYALTCPTYSWAKETAKFSKVYAYHFTQRTAGEVAPEWMGAMHSAELPYVFGDPALDPVATDPESFNKEDKPLSLVVMSYWTNFVKYGDPNGGGDGGIAAKHGIKLRNWPVLPEGTTCPSRIFEINTAMGVRDTGDPVQCRVLDAHKCSFWQDFYPNFLGILFKQNRAGDACTEGLEIYHNKDLYPDTDDCHYYYQCFYHNASYADAIRRKCAQGLFWHDTVLQCLPEGDMPCSDRCLNDTTQSKGCYAGAGCRQFFMCSNTASYGMCCPFGTRFSETNCTCEDDPQCTDSCIQSGPLVPTTVAPPQLVNASVCRDSFGTPISMVPGTPGAYIPLDLEGNPTVKLFCPETIFFNISTCRCDIETGIAGPPPERKRQPVFWAPFNNDTLDHSMNKFATFLFDDVKLDSITWAQGNGSLHLNGGYLSVPGLKTFDLGKAASFCAFFKCEDGLCSTKGGILSNYKDENEYTVVIAIEYGNMFIGRLHFWHPNGTVTMKSQIQVPTNGWNHACITYDGNTVRLYLNAAVTEAQLVGSHLAIAHVPYMIGNDLSFGAFRGYIDDVIIAPFAMSQEEFYAHQLQAGL